MIVQTMDFIYTNIQQVLQDIIILYFLLSK